ncbi:MAG: ABC transporter permease [Acidobacteria bacterium]|nr:ABC transporter permease [Acidobacteriota bacterium]
MGKVLALVRASWLEALSYRVKMVFTLAGLLAAALPFFYIANALQPLMARSIAQEGGQYLAFLVVGMVTFAFLRTAISSLPEEVGRAIASGTLEAMLGTPTRMPALLGGLIGYSFVWTGVRAIVFVGLAWLMGAHFIWGRGLMAAGILALIVVTHITFGVMAAALILAFRTAGPLEGIIVWVSTILGGVYYPTTAIPDWLARVSDFVPLTYGLRAMRRALLDTNIDYALLRGDLQILLASGVVLTAVSLAAFGAALRYARAAGTLAQY